MAEVGGSKNDGQTVIVGGSECVFDFYCEICRDDSKHVEAAGFCVDCEEYLCETCVSSHKRARPCRFHKILDKTEMPKDTPLTHDRAIKTINTRCKAHPGEPVKFYCKDHSMFGCTTCFATGHRTCGGIESIVEKSETVLDCGEFKTFIQNLSSMKHTLSSVIETLQSNIADTRQDCQNAVTSVREFRKKINKILDEVEQRIIAKAHSVSTEEIAKLENLLQEVRSLSEKVDTISSETEELRTSRQICQLYIKMKEMDKYIKELLCRVSDIAHLKPVKRLSFQPSAELRNRFEKDTAFGDLSEIEIAVRHTKDVGELNSEYVGDITITHDNQMRPDFHQHIVGWVEMPEGWGSKEKDEKTEAGSPQPTSQPQQATTAQLGQTNPVVTPVAGVAGMGTTGSSATPQTPVSGAAAQTPASSLGAATPTTPGTNTTPGASTPSSGAVKSLSSVTMGKEGADKKEGKAKGQQYGPGPSLRPKHVENRKEVVGRGAMLQWCCSKDAQSPAASSLDSQTKTPLNGPPMSAGGTAGGDRPPAPLQQHPNTPLRPGAGQGPGGMPMGPPGPYCMPRGCQGLMPPFVIHQDQRSFTETQFRGHYPPLHSMLRQDQDIERRYRQEAHYRRDTSILGTPWSRASHPQPCNKARVQIYCHRRSDKINTLLVSLGSQLHTQFDTINTDLTCTSCDQKEQLDMNTPTIVPCINTKKLGKVVTSSLEGLEGLSWTNKVVVVVLHEKDTQALPPMPSNQRLTCTEYKSLGGLIDMAFLPNKGIYPCDMNIEALKALMSFINDGRID